MNNHDTNADATFVAQPGRSVVGTFRDVRSGQPIAEVEVRLDASVTSSILEPLIRATSGVDGRFRLDGRRDDSVVLLSARPAPGVPWLAMDRGMIVREAKDAGVPPLVEADFAMTRGVWATGRVVDAMTKQPRAARVQTRAFADSPIARRDDPMVGLIESWADTGDDDRFRLLVCPGPGVVTARIVQPNSPNGVGDDQNGIGSEAIVGRRDLETLPRGFSPRKVITIAAIDPAPTPTR